ncbi:hypothetical protein MMC18_001607 [Xylographa bjoerkii]|nr:hypothetical protein [Xylographa bjoerkii]
MEHFLLPANPPSDEIKVPCVCDPPYYDGESGSFITFPREKDRPWLVAVEVGENFRLQISRYERLHLLPMQELQKFYQEWLFFGFLKEIMGNDFNTGDFISEEADGVYITTRNLPSMLEEVWSRHPITLSPDAAAYQHVVDCVSIIHTVAKTLQHETGPPPSFDWGIVLSIASCARMIATSM